MKIVSLSNQDKHMQDLFKQRWTLDLIILMKNLVILQT
jgi:hypothetical protein